MIKFSNSEDYARFKIMNIRRINLFAGPCSGKSRRAAWLFSEMKERQMSVELITEYVKSWAYEKREVTGFDQIYLFAKQMRREELALRNGVQYIISDSPIKLAALYAKKYSPEFFEHLSGLADVFENKYPSLNIFIQRGDNPYSQEGRYQNYEEAKELDAFIWENICKDKGVNHWIKPIEYDNCESWDRLVEDLEEERK